MLEKKKAEHLCVICGRPSKTSSFHVECIGGGMAIGFKFVTQMAGTIVDYIASRRRR